MTDRTERPPKVRPPMDIGERAKQFAPYAALGSMEPYLRDVAMGRDVGDMEHEEFFEDLEWLTDLN